MQRFRQHLPWIVRICLALFLFSQFSLAAQACVSAQASPVQAFEHTHCHDDADSTSSPNPNACLTHCIQGDQALDTQPQALTAQASAAITLPVAYVAPASQLSPLVPAVVAINSSPPIPILYCRFLN